MDNLEATIQTNRLTLQPISPMDAEDLFAIMRDPAIGTALGEPPPESVEAIRARIVSWVTGPGPGDDERWLNWLARTQAGHPVGHVAATIRGSLAWLAWIVGVENQRLGYATEAARAVKEHLAAGGIDPILASIREGHVASEGVARNLGLLLTDERIDGERVWRG